MKESGIGKRIKEVRDYYGMTQQEFGERIQLARNTITGYEKVGHTPSKRVVTLICSSYGVNEKWLLTGEGKMLVEGTDKLIKLFQQKYNLPPEAISLLEVMVELTPEQMSVVSKFINRLCDKEIKRYAREEAQKEKMLLHDDLDREIDAQKKVEESSTGSDSIAG